MRVNQSGSNPISSADTASAQHAKKTGKAAHPTQGKGAEAAPATSVSSDSATAEISGKARDFATARAAAANAPDVREAKIAELKSRIASGKYGVDANAVADRMVDEHLSMSGIG